MEKFKVIYILIFVLILSSCDKGAWHKYEGDNSELYTAAYLSLPGSVGGSYDTLEIIAEDNYGRILYRIKFFELTLYKDTGMFLFISQKIDDEYTYVYDSYNYVALERDSIDFDLYEEQLSDFLELNDWNNPLNDEKLTKMKSDFWKERVENDTRDQILDIIKSDTNLDESNWIEVNMYNQDYQGNLIYLVIKYDESDNVSLLYLLHLSDTYEILNEETYLREVEIEYLSTMQDILYNFKIDNNWDLDG